MASPDDNNEGSTSIAMIMVVFTVLAIVIIAVLTITAIMMGQPVV